MFIDKLILEEYYKYLHEIDWDDTYSDVSCYDFGNQELIDYLNWSLYKKYKLKSRGNKNAKINTDIFVHTNKAQDSSGSLHKLKPAELEKLYKDYEYKRGENFANIDPKKVAELITAKPKKVLSGTEKFKHTSDDKFLVVGVGIPAKGGLVFDKERNEFKIVGTCPGAGSCLLICFGLKGNYIYKPDVMMHRTRVLNLMLNEPEEFKRLVIKDAKEEAKTLITKNKSLPKTLSIRWNDVGDFFSEKYYQMAKEITAILSKDPFFKGNNITLLAYAYTKVGKYAIIGDDGITKTFSFGSKKDELDFVLKLNKEGKADTKFSYVVPKTVFLKYFLTNNKYLLGKLRKTYKFLRNSTKEEIWEFVKTMDNDIKEQFINYNSPNPHYVYDKNGNMVYDEAFGGEEGLKEELIKRYNGLEDYFVVTKENLLNTQELATIPDNREQPKKWVTYVLPKTDND